AGERAEVVQREAGHEHISTTLGYAKEVQDRRGRYGEPFPALPAVLVGSGTPPGSPDVTERQDAKLDVPRVPSRGRSTPSFAAPPPDRTFSNPASPTQSLPRPRRTA